MACPRCVACGAPSAGSVGGCLRGGGTGQGAGCACAATLAGGSGFGSGIDGPAGAGTPPSLDPEPPPAVDAPAICAGTGCARAGGAALELEASPPAGPGADLGGTACNFPAVRVAGNDACSINIKDRREPGGNCWRKGAKSSPSSSAAKITAKAASMSIAEKDMARPKGCYRTPGRREKATSSRDSCRHDGSLMSMRTHVCYTTSFVCAM